MSTLARLVLIGAGTMAGCTTIVIGGGTSGGTTGGTQTPAAPAFDVTLVNGRPEVRTADNATLVMAPRGPAISSRNSGPSDGVQPTTEVVPRDDGFDLIATFINPSTRERPQNVITLATFTLGSEINVPDMRWGGRDRPMSLSNVQPIVEIYPGDLYSPVAVLANDEVAVGVSAMYPVLEYKHDVSFAYRAEPGSNHTGEGGQGWVIYIYFSKYGPTSRVVDNSAMLAPGETRQYTFTVRFSDTPDEWIRTLKPYQEYFTNKYGPVKYQRNTEPVIGYPIATASSQGSTNPDGWARGRPDVHGFRDTVSALIASNPEYERLLVWAPTGLYQTAENFPWQFTSRWLDSPEFRTALDQNDGFPRVARAGKSLGLWWGRTGKYMPAWNPERPEVVDFDIRNPLHRQHAFREMDLAVQAGVEFVGMDAFTLPLWDGVEWLEVLSTRYPGVTFVLEPRQCDILNNLAAMYLRGYGDINDGPSPSERTNIKAPHYLADMLNPGHEIWAALRWDQYRRERGTPATNAIRIEDAVHAAENGYIPLMFDAIPRSSSFIAAESWMFSIPPEMRPGGGSGGNSGGSGGNTGGSGGNNNGSTGGSGGFTGGGGGGGGSSGGFIGGGGGTSGGPLPGTPNLQRPEQTRQLRTARSMIAGPSDQVLSRLGDEPERRVVTRPSRPRVVVTRDGRVSPPDDE